MSINTLAILLMISVLLSANVLPVVGQSSSNLSKFLVNIQIAPSHLDSKNTVQPIGYVNLVTKTGIAVTAPQDIAVGLESDDPEIASVPSMVIIPEGRNYAKFDITIGNIDGETTISSLFNGKIDFKNIKVGGTDASLPDDLDLVMNLPTKNMHVNSEMPFSVYLKSDDKVVRAPYDILIDIDYEKSLIKTQSSQLVINKGDYYSWGVLNTFGNVGNAFLRASNDRFDIDTAVNIEITSSLPSGIKIDVFPKRIGALPERHLDVFVSLIDSEGNPAVTPEDVTIELFSNNDSVGNKLDAIMKEKKVVIRKGQFGYYFQAGVDLQGLEDKKVTIGASIENLGIAVKDFFPVQSLNIEHPKAENSTLNIFVLPEIPSNTTSIMIYQVVAEGTDIELTECLELDIECIKNNKQINKLEHPIDELGSGEFYPIQVNDNYVSQGSFKNINVVSSDNSILSIVDRGKLESSHSFGTAIVKSGQRTGEVTIAATVKGIGAGVNSTKVVDVFKHTATKIFSPTGDNKIVLDKNGYFDLFLIALDEKQRPKILETGTKYILNPVNAVIEIKKNNSFAYANFRSDSFNAGLNDSILVSAVPVGVKAELTLEEKTSFVSQVSSIVKIKLPFENIAAESEEPYEGVVQLTDLLGNPTTSTRDLRINLVLDGPEIVFLPESVVIEQGSSHASFPITPNGEHGDATIAASVKGVIGSDSKISTSSNLLALNIFANGIESPIPVNKPIQLEVFIDDENAESVPGAIVTFTTDPAVASITPQNTRTNVDGSIIADLTVFGGPEVSIQVIATAEGYQNAEQTFDYAVSGDMGSSIALGLPDWVIYVGVAAVLGIVAVVFVFLKKPPKEDYDEDEEYEYEEEI